MERYRIFILDGFGHVVRHDAIDCAGDAEALAHADIARGTSAAEIWLGGRFIARLGDAFGARPSPAAPSVDQSEPPAPDRSGHPKQ